MKPFLLVFIGGGAGSVLRFWISRWLDTENGIPWGTFTVNILGSFLIGFILGINLKQHYFSPNTTLLLATGFCGGFTTFSAFAYQNQAFLRAGEWLQFGSYTLASIIVGILAVFPGIYLGKSLFA